jgi:hypothetical protein
MSPRSFFDQSGVTSERQNQRHVTTQQLRLTVRRNANARPSCTCCRRDDVRCVRRAGPVALDGGPLMINERDTSMTHGRVIAGIAVVVTSMAMLALTVLAFTPKSPAPAIPASGQGQTTLVAQPPAAGSATVAKPDRLGLLSLQGNKVVVLSGGSTLAAQGAQQDATCPNEEPCGP